MLARKPLIGTVAENVQTFGTGALNIDASRIGYANEADKAKVMAPVDGTKGYEHHAAAMTGGIKRMDVGNPQGRFPANVLFDEDAAAVLDAQSGEVRSSGTPSKTTRKWNKDDGTILGFGQASTSYSDKGGASRFFKVFEREEQLEADIRDALIEGRTEDASDLSVKLGEVDRRDSCPVEGPFFYVAKASKRERNSGCEELITWDDQDQNLQALMAELSQLAKGISDDTMQPQGGSDLNTFLYTRLQTDQFSPAFRYTISTVSKMITDLRTSNSSRPLSISVNIPAAIRAIQANGLSLAESAELVSQLIATSTRERSVLVLGAVLAALKTLSQISALGKQGNVHSTVKPVKLMEYLVRMITPPGGTVLDPFCGSGTTGVACKRLGFEFYGIEREAAYAEIAERRCEALA